MDEQERAELLAENQRLRKALQQFARYYNEYTDDPEGYYVEIPYARCKEAYDALRK